MAVAEGGVMERAKALGLFRLEVNGALDTYDIYGMGVYRPETAATIEAAAMKLVERLGESDG